MMNLGDLKFYLMFLSLNSKSYITLHFHPIFFTVLKFGLPNSFQYTLFFIGNSIFNLSLELLTKFWKMRLKVA